MARNKRGSGSLSKIRLRPFHKNLYAIVDRVQYSRLRNFDWYLNNCGYALRYVDRTKSILMHREILGVWDKRMVDHKNTNRLDNRTCNLRIATKSQNGHNRPAPRTNRSGCPGVWYDKARRKYQAFIHNKGKKIHLGRFLKKADAVRAYVLAAKKIKGSFVHSSLNKILEVAV